MSSYETGGIKRHGHKYVTVPQALHEEAEQSSQSKQPVKAAEHEQHACMNVVPER
jgi:hypothetical protein